MISCDKKLEPSCQIAAGFASLEWLREPELAFPYIKEAADAGYVWYVLLVRQMIPNVLDKQVCKMVQKIADIVHQCGMKFYLDTDPTHFSESITAVDPDAALQCILPIVCTADKGHFQTVFRLPSSARQQKLLRISALYCTGRPGEPVPEKNFTFIHQHCSVGGNAIDCEGQLADDYSGEVRFYVLMNDYRNIDHASGTLYQTIKEMLESYQGIKIDGIGWDEPGKIKGSTDFFRAGNAFFKRFRERNGYDLEEHLIYLDTRDSDPHSCKVRCDYYRTLSDMHYDVQKYHNELALSIFGKDIMLGTHQTWCGLPPDLSAGVFDHFRLGELLTEAWSDGGYEYEPKTILFPFVIADSLKKGLNKNHAYYNDWQYRPDPYCCDYFNSLKMLFKINSFTMGYSDYNETLVNHRFGVMKRLTDALPSKLDFWNSFSSGMDGDSEIALYYGYEGYASLPKEFTRAVYAFYQNTSLFLIDSSMFPELISSKILLGSKVSNGIMITENGRKYRTLILPYAHVLCEGVWEKLLEFTSAGLPVIFIGPDPHFSADGKTVPFHEYSGFSSTGVPAYRRGLSNAKVQLAYNQWEPFFIEAQIPYDSDSEVEAEYDNYGRLLLLKGKNNFYWMPCFDPRENLIKVLQKLIPLPKIEVVSTNSIYRVFQSDANADEWVLALMNKAGTAGWNNTPSSQEKSGAARPPIRFGESKGIVKIDGQIVCEFSHCGFAAVRFNGKTLLDEFSPDGNLRVQKVSL